MKNNELLTKANNFKIKSYARINTADTLKKALNQNGPCVICFYIYDHSVTMWKPKKVGREIIGGHAMAVVGYDEKILLSEIVGVKIGEMMDIVIILLMTGVVIGKYGQQLMIKALKLKYQNVVLNLVL